MNKFILIILAVIMTSCATIMNSKYTTIEINSIPSDATVIVNNSDSSKKTPTVIFVPRSKEPLWLTIKKDTSRKDIVLKSKLTNAFWLGNLFFGAGIIGYAIDLTNPKRFKYDEEIFVDLNKKTTVNKFIGSRIISEKKYSRWLVDYDIPINLTFSLPHINQYYMKRRNDYWNRFGFWGFSTGLEYYLDKSKYLSLQTAAVADIIIPFPAAIDYEGEFERYAAVFCNVKMNNKIEKLHLGYGLQYSRLSWSKTDSLSEIADKRINNCLGLSLTCYYQVWKRFYIGVIYQPSFLSLNNGVKMDYQHYIGIDFIWKIKLYDFNERRK